MGERDGKSRKRVMKLGAVNIRTHPHSPDGYVHLFREAQKSALATPFRGNKHATVGGYEKTRTDRGAALVGHFQTYTDFDANKKWYNKREKTQVLANSLGTDLRIFDTIKPEADMIWFVFFIELHLLVFEAKVSPSSMKALIEGLFTELAKQNGQTLNTSVFQRPEALEEIYRMPFLRQLTIYIGAPNPDDGGEIEKELERRLLSQNADGITETLDAATSDGIKPDERTKKLAEIALRNGSVTARGTRADGTTGTLKTTEQPVTYKFTFNLNQGLKTAVIEGALALLRKLKL